jgi:hypothetical protein
LWGDAVEEAGKEKSLGETQRRRLLRVVRGVEIGSCTLVCLWGWREGPAELMGREGEGGEGGKTVAAMVQAWGAWAADVEQGRVACVLRDKEREAWEWVVKEGGMRGREGKWWREGVRGGKEGEGADV